ncbi:uncharacterized protein [Paralichthys olivaceus]|uniref:uncharacterized protein n=1 Tax=Paralichthys olivaceus TaxID=8255 RepID=UPI003751C87E
MGNFLSIFRWFHHNKKTKQTPQSEAVVQEASGEGKKKKSSWWRRLCSFRFKKKKVKTSTEDEGVKNDLPSMTAHSSESDTSDSSSIFSNSKEENALSAEACHSTQRVSISTSAGYTEGKSNIYPSTEDEGVKSNLPSLTVRSSESDTSDSSSIYSSSKEEKALSAEACHSTQRVSISTSGGYTEGKSNIYPSTEDEGVKNNLPSITAHSSESDASDSSSIYSSSKEEKALSAEACHSIQRVSIPTSAGYIQGKSNIYPSTEDEGVKNDLPSITAHSSESDTSDSSGSIYSSSKEEKALSAEACHSIQRVSISTSAGYIKGKSNIYPSTEDEGVKNDLPSITVPGSESDLGYSSSIYSSSEEEKPLSAEACHSIQRVSISTSGGYTEGKSNIYPSTEDEGVKNNLPSITAHSSESDTSDSSSIYSSKGKSNIYPSTEDEGVKNDLPSITVPGSKSDLGYSSSIFSSSQEEKALSAEACHSIQRVSISTSAGYIQGKSNIYPSTEDEGVKNDLPSITVPGSESDLGYSSSIYSSSEEEKALSAEACHSIQRVSIPTSAGYIEGKSNIYPSTEDEGVKNNLPSITAHSSESDTSDSSSIFSSSKEEKALSAEACHSIQRVSISTSAGHIEGKSNIYPSTEDGVKSNLPSITVPGSESDLGYSSSIYSSSEEEKALSAEACHSIQRVSISTSGGYIEGKSNIYPLTEDEGLKNNLPSITAHSSESDASDSSSIYSSSKEEKALSAEACHSIQRVSISTSAGYIEGKSNIYPSTEDEGVKNDLPSITVPGSKSDTSDSSSIFSSSREEKALSAEACHSIQRVSISTSGGYAEGKSNIYPSTEDEGFKNNLPSITVPGSKSDTSNSSSIFSNSKEEKALSAEACHSIQRVSISTSGGYTEGKSNIYPSTEDEGVKNNLPSLTVRSSESDTSDSSSIYSSSKEEKALSAEACHSIQRVSIPTSAGYIQGKSNIYPSTEDEGVKNDLPSITAHSSESDASDSSGSIYSSSKEEKALSAEACHSIQRVSISTSGGYIKGKSNIYPSTEDEGVKNDLPSITVPGSKSDTSDSSSIFSSSREEKALSAEACHSIQRVSISTSGGYAEGKSNIYPSTEDEGFKNNLPSITVPGSKSDTSNSSSIYSSSKEENALSAEACHSIQRVSIPTSAGHTEGKSNIYPSTEDGVKSNLPSITVHSSESDTSDSSSIFSSSREEKALSAEACPSIQKVSIPTSGWYTEGKSTIYQDNKETLCKKDISCLGFPNLRQTCYMNSSLQVLMNLFDFVQDVHNQEKVWTSYPYSKLMRQFMELKLCHRNKNAKKRRVLASFKDTVAEEYSEFKDNYQKDASEFLSCVLNMMRSQSIDLQAIADSKGMSYTCPVDAHVAFEMLSTRTCTKCHIQCMTSSDHLQLSLNLVPGGTVSDCLQQYLKGGQFECSCDCGGTESTECSSFLTLPNVLIIHLMRATFTRELGENRLERPLVLSRELELDGQSSCTKQTHYSLVSIISHFGSTVNDGHYICESTHRDLCDVTDCWLTYNDQNVTKTTGTSVCEMRQEDAYMLFYEKKSEKWS